MIVNFIYLLIVSLSSIGFGVMLLKKTNTTSEEFYNYGIFGIVGLFFLNLSSYTFSLISQINSSINLLIILLGVFFFILNFKKINIKFFYLYGLIFVLLFFAILIGKPHDDFHYYHFPYIYYLINSDFIFGIGHVNHGFRTPSSIFYLNAILFNKFTGYGTFHFGAALYLLFANLYIIEKIKFYLGKNKNFIIFLISIFIFSNIFFYRIGEHGTDRSAQILSLIFIFEIFILFNLKKNINERIKIMLILLGLIISLKAFYILFFIFPIIIIGHLFFSLKKNFHEIIKLTFLNFFFILFMINFLLILCINFINTGCFIYPVGISCINDLPWSIGTAEADKMKNWYELWSKGGATPNMRVSNPSEYLQQFNWVGNWFRIYFLNKVSDFILGLTLTFLIIFFTFKLNFKLSRYKFSALLICLVILILEWFYNHPALRYGGYSLFAAMFFVYLSSLSFNKHSNLKKFKTGINYMVILALVVFLGRNINRVNKEVTQYNYNPLIEFNYSIINDDFRISKQINHLKESLYCKKINNEKYFCKKYELQINNLTLNKLFISRDD
tara:strand:+ start:7348 stop:9015 length:1668 start_codon:yes stop_codon:yes gene_type:complete